MRSGAVIAAAVLASVATAAEAQQQPEAFEPEIIQIGLSTDRVTLTAGFSGTNLTIFGSLDNVDPLQARTRGYDVIVVLEGPANQVVVRRKTSFLGMWINTRSETFVNVPTSYSVATTRPPQDITDPQNYKRLSLGTSNIFLQPKNPRTSPDAVQEFGEALRDRKRAEGLFSSNYGGVEFLSRSLFRATLRLAADVPVGTHRARAFLFKNGEFVQETSSQLEIRKSGFEQSIFDTAHQRSFVFGIIAVLIAMLMGWVGRLIFRKE